MKLVQSMLWEIVQLVINKLKILNLRSLFIFLFLIVASFGVHGQGESISGEVTFVTSNNVYVKFSSTNDISIGDTLELFTNTACLIVKSKSSTSTVCSIIENCELSKGDKVTYQIKRKVPVAVAIEEDVSVDNIEATEEEPLYKEKIKGRLSVSSYNNIASKRDNRYRIMSRFSFNVSHINNSKFSFETYLNYRYKFPVAESTVTKQSSFFRVYNLAIRFDVDPTLSLILGRKINSKAWSLGAIDGLQAEKFFGKTYVGAIAGFRPDIYDYSFNSNLFEYAAYIGRQTKSDNIYSETTLGYVEQRNGNQIDRRYTFFQFSSTLFKKLNLFSSAELDLYSKVNGESATDARLTNLYASARYRFSRKFDVFLSYDSRKRIIYYETFQSEIERMLDDDLARQGIGARVNIRPIKYVTFGLSYSKRFESDNQNKSDNIYGYASLLKIPKVGGRLSISYNINKSNYLESRVLSFRHSRTLIKQKLNAEFYYRLVDYIYTNSVSDLKQNYFGANFSYNISRRLLFSISGELSTFNTENNYRIYAKIVKRFYGKEKK